MARPLKKGLDYFPFDVDFYSDIKVRKLVKYQGGKSVSVYACLLCNIYRNGYYLVWDNELPFIISEQTGFEEAYILEVVKNCVNIGLFSKEIWEKSQVLTSVGIQFRYNNISKLLKRKVAINDFLLINSEETIVNSELTTVNSVKSTQRKEKEKKEREREKEIPPPHDFENKSLKPLSECKDEILQDVQYLEIIAMNNHLGSVEKAKEWVMLFFKQLQNEGIMRKSIQDFKSHFGRWLPIKLQQTNGKESEKETIPTRASF